MTQQHKRARAVPHDRARRVLAVTIGGQRQPRAPTGRSAVPPPPARPAHSSSAAPRRAAIAAAQLHCVSGPPKARDRKARRSAALAGVPAEGQDVGRRRQRRGSGRRGQRQRPRQCQLSQRNDATTTTTCFAKLDKIMLARKHKEPSGNLASRAQADTNPRAQLDSLQSTKRLNGNKRRTATSGTNLRTNQVPAISKRQIRARTTRCSAGSLLELAESQRIGVQPGQRKPTLYTPAAIQKTVIVTPRRTRSSQARYMSNLAIPSSSSSSSSSGSSNSVAALAQQFKSDQAAIQTITDRLRQRIELARMLTTSNLRQESASPAEGPNGGHQRLGAPSAAAAAVLIRTTTNEMDLMRSKSRVHHWNWSDTDKSYECVVSKDKLSLCFHPDCSESAAVCLGEEPFRRNGNYYYWEIHVQDKIYGTSVMFGLCTKQQRLHANEYCNLVGLDETGWSLSHKGLAWHQGKNRQYTKMFPTNQPITIGLLYNTMRGELSYFMDGKNLGVAFTGLNEVGADLYPVVGSTAKCTRMRLIGSYCGYVSLLERSCFTVLKCSRNKGQLVDYLSHYQLPKNLMDYVAANICRQDDQSSSDSNQSSNTSTAKDESLQMNCPTRVQVGSCVRPAVFSSHP